MKVNDIYQAICDGQTLHPDPEDQEGFIFLFLFYLFNKQKYYNTR